MSNKRNRRRAHQRVRSERGHGDHKAPTAAMTAFLLDQAAARTRNARERFLTAPTKTERRERAKRRYRWRYAARPFRPRKPRKRTAG